MLSLLIWSLVLSIVINLAMFLVAFNRQSDKLTDASYAISFIAIALYDYSKSSSGTYSKIGLLLVVLWAIRIGSFLIFRVLKVGKDKRFDGMRENFTAFGKFWLGQAITAWLLLVPYALALKKHTNWHKLALIGVAVWLLGLIIETIADTQKYRFHEKARNKKKWIESGVWHYSRHPNYFGEILVWLGIYLFALTNLNSLDKVIGLISPLFITILLRFVSGIPILEKSADKKWGNEPDYKEYKKRTSLLILLPNKKL